MSRIFEGDPGLIFRLVPLFELASSLNFPNSFLTCQLKVTDILKYLRKEKKMLKSLVFLMLLKKGSHVTDFRRRSRTNFPTCTIIRTGIV